MLDKQLGIYPVTPYEFFSYGADEDFYRNSTFLQAAQVDAIDRGAGRIVSAIEGQSYYQRRSIDLQGSIYRGLEAQTPVLQDIRSALLNNGQYVRDLGVSVGRSNQYLSDISGALYDSVLLQEDSNTLQAQGNYLQARGNKLNSQGNQILLGIASMVATKSGMEISDFLPKYFPKPAIPKPKTLPGQINSAQARLAVSASLFSHFQIQFGDQTLFQHFLRYSELKDAPIRSYQPSGIVDQMIFNAYKIGRDAQIDFDTSTSEYKSQLDQIADTIAQTVRESNLKSHLEELGNDVWRVTGAELVPIMVDLNYGDIPVIDRKVLAGYALVSPPRYRPAEMSVLTASAYVPMEQKYYPDLDKTFTYTYDGIVISDRDLPKAGPFNFKLKQSDWQERRDLSGDRNRYLFTRYSIHPYSESVHPDQLLETLGELQTSRTLSGKIPHALETAGNAALRSDKQQRDRLYEQYKARRVARQQAKDKVSLQLAELQNSPALSSGENRQPSQMQLILEQELIKLNDVQYFYRMPGESNEDWIRFLQTGVNLKEIDASLDEYEKRQAAFAALTGTPSEKKKNPVVALTIPENRTETSTTTDTPTVVDNADNITPEYFPPPFSARLDAQDAAHKEFVDSGYSGNYVEILNKHLVQRGFKVVMGVSSATPSMIDKITTL